MKSKKSEKADLEGKRFIFLEIGFIVALLITFAAFSWKSPEREFSGFFASTGAEISEEQIPVTRQQSPPPPPPPVDAFELNIVDDRVELEEQTVLQMLKLTLTRNLIFQDIGVRRRTD
jgi:protein TonB